MKFNIVSQPHVTTVVFFFLETTMRFCRSSEYFKTIEKINYADQRQSSGTNIVD